MIRLDYKLRNQFTIIIFMMVCLIILIITKKIMIEDHMYQLKNQI